MLAKNALTYLVRIWLEPGQGGGVWRASVTDLATRQVRYFAHPASLLGFLEQHITSPEGHRDKS